MSLPKLRFKNASFLPKWVFSLIVSFMSFNTMTIWAYSTRIGDLEYYLYPLEETAQVNGIYYMAYPTKITVPETVTDKGIEYKVTGIMSEAFKDKSFEECVLPESITTIGEGAFENCKNLKSITIPSKVERIENKTFSKCTSLENVNLSQNIYWIGDQAFSFCSKLQGLEFPDKIYTIGMHAFYNCASLDKVVLSSNFEALGTSAFSNTGIRIVDLSKCRGMWYIPNYAFSGCSLLEFVKFPPNLSKIGNGAFALDEKIKSIILPPALKEIEGNSAFDGCKIIKAAYPSTLSKSPLKSGIGIVYPANSVYMKDSVIYNKSQTILYFAPLNISSFECPEGLTTISSNAFAYCDLLESIEIPASVSQIGRNAFGNCPSITKFSIQNSESFLEIEGRPISSDQNIKQFYLGRNCTNNSFGSIDIDSLELGELLMDGRALKCGNYKSLTRIVSHAKNPPLMNPFTQEQYKNIEVDIPDNALNSYCADSVWRPFFHVGIEDISFGDVGYEVGVNRELQLKPIITPAYATENELKWSSSNDEIASVDSQGIVTAKREGTCRVTVKSIENENISTSCLINVTPVYVTSFEISPTEWKGKAGERFLITVTSMLPEDATNKSVTYSIDSDYVVRLDEDGYFSALHAGEAVIIVSANGSQGCYAECKVTVEPAPVTAIEMTPGSYTCVVGGSVSISANVLPQYASNKVLSWSSSDEKIAEVDKRGKIIAKGVGKCVITAAATDGSGVTATCEITVNPVLVESMTLTPDEWNGIEGETFQITAAVLPENATDKTLEWSSSNEFVATVDNSGLVSVLKEGSCIITTKTTDGSEISAECIVTSTSGIDDIFADADERFDIYNMQGVLIKKDCNRDSLKMLSSGIYILRQGRETRKLIIR